MPCFSEMAFILSTKSSSKTEPSIDFWPKKIGARIGTRRTAILLLSDQVVDAPNSNHFAGLCQSLALSAPEVIEFAGLTTYNPTLQLYAKELGRLCQGIGTGNKAGGKKVEGTNTFHLITFADIPHHKQKEIIYTKVVCEIHEGKDDENCMRITVGGNLICKCY